MEAPKLAYFDHNILSDLTDLPEEALDRIFEGFKAQVVIPVYSDETLHEVAKSTDRIELMLDLFTNYSFQHLFEEIVEHKPTDGVLLSADMEPRVRFNQLLESNEKYPDEPAGMDFVRKVHGAAVDGSYFDILFNALNDAESQAKETLAGLEGHFSEEKLKEIKKSLASIPETREQLISQKAELEEASSANKATVLAIREQFGADGGKLNSIEGERIIERIWEVIGEAAGAPEVTAKVFFEGNINELQDGFRFSESIPTRVSAIYQQLNLIGYWKDEDMKKDRGFNSAQSDGKHVGMAAMCSVFFSNDDRCRKKARAAFQFVGSNCRIVSLDITQSDIENEPS